MADISQFILPNNVSYNIKDATARSEISNKQDTLVSGTNIKTINGESIVGSGNLVLSTGAGLFYGTCATAAATAAKVVVCEEFTSSDLVEGTVINVKFTNAQTYNGAPTLNVQSTGAKNIKRIGTTNAARYEWQAGEVLQFVYDGTYWMLTDGGVATTTYYGVTKLSSATNSTSTSLAATASAVKAAYDHADSKQDALVSGTNIKTINNESLLGSGNITISSGSSSAFTGATASSAGTQGLVPAPSAGQNASILVGEGGWHNLDLDSSISSDSGSYGLDLVLGSVTQSGGATDILELASTHVPVATTTEIDAQVVAAGWTTTINSANGVSF